MRKLKQRAALIPQPQMRPRQEPIVSKETMIDYASDALATGIVAKYPDADFRFPGWESLFNAVYTAAEDTYNKRTENGKTYMRVDHLVLRTTFRQFVKEMLERVSEDPELMRSCGIEIPAAEQPPTAAGSQ